MLRFLFATVCLKFDTKLFGRRDGTRPKFRN
jgi:hypothetical protein